MLVVETIAKIRRAYFKEGRSIRQICRDLRVSRKTVRKVIRSGETEFSYQRSVQSKPRIDPFRKALDEILADNAGRAKRERLTLIRIFEELRALGYEGGYDAVRRYAASWSKSEAKASAAAYVPLSFDPGEAYQFDWSHEVVIIDGVTTTIKVAHIRLCHSRMLFVRAYPRETQEMVFDAHDRAFALFKGTCGRGIYDNMKTAVETVFVGKDRLYNRRFLQMCSHYLVEPVACTPGAGWEKGQVENQVGTVRKWLFASRPRFKNFAELNGWLNDQCISICKKRKHPEDKSRTVWDVFEEEGSSLIPVSSMFQGYSETECRVSSTSLIRYDRNHYSVDSKLAGKTATIRASADRIKVVSNGRLVADHPRQFSRDKVMYNPWHYLRVLERKPGALRNGAPFQEWDLPNSLARVRSRLSSYQGGDREFVDILLAVQRCGIDIVDQACKKALAEGTVRGEVILNIIARHLDPQPIDTARIPESLSISVEPTSDCSRYDALRQEVEHGAS